MIRGAVFLCALPLAAQSPTDSGRELYRANCYVCHGQDGDAVAGVNFRGGIRRATTDEEISRIIAGGIPGTGMPPTNLTEAQRGALVAYLRSMRAGASVSNAPGDAGRGLAILEGKGGCLTCHRAGGKGSYLGPDLSDIGLTRQAAYLQDEILNPRHSIAPQNRMVEVILKDGKQLTGRRLNEDTHTLLLIDSNERLVSISKSQVRQFSLLETSPMPSYQNKLSQQEVADVVGYLLSLRGPQ